jgi:IS605 OrfB family transposase
MTCNAVRQTVGAYNTLQAQVTIGQSEWHHLTFRPTSYTVSYNRDYTISETTLGITTLDGRKKYPIRLHDHARKFFDGSWTFGASKLVRLRNGRYFFHLCCEKEIEPTPIEDATTFMGVDVGQNYLAVASTTDRQCAFYYGGSVKSHRRVYSQMRTRLQTKGTRSAKRVLKNLEHREQRLMTAINHDVSKSLITFAVRHTVDVIALEDLTGIHTITTRPKDDPYTHHRWAFFQLQHFIAYKALERGIRVIYVDPRYTSQTCPRCSHISRNNRHGRSFHCECCGYDLHADLVGARNLEARARDSRYTCELQGRPSTAQTEPSN